MAGPCCCSSNIQAAKVLGIIFIVCSLFNCLGTDANESRTSNIVTGLVGALISGLLVYGASKRNSTAILVWMILAIIECIVFAILAILAIVGLGYVHSEAIGYAIIGKVIQQKKISKGKLSKYKGASTSCVLAVILQASQVSGVYNVSPSLEFRFNPH